MIQQTDVCDAYNTLYIYLNNTYENNKIMYTDK